MEFLKGIFCLAICCGCVFLFIAFAIHTENEMNKRNCYEIYATDNVILKRCEKYFERGKE